MNIDNISLSINEVELELKNATPEQLFSVIKVISGDVKRSNHSSNSNETKKPKKKKSLRQRYRGKKTSNYQFESQARSLNDNFDIDAAFQIPALNLSIDSGNPLGIESKQLSSRKDIVWIFACNGNQPLTNGDIFKEIVKNNDDVSLGTVSNYVSQCVRLGVLAKNKVNNTLHLSKWFLDQV